jgi:hypothetical protein
MNWIFLVLGILLPSVGLAQEATLERTSESHIPTVAAAHDRDPIGIDIVGISNFVTFLEHTEGYRRDLRRVEYGDERDPEMRAFLLKISPLNHVAERTKAIFCRGRPERPASTAGR